MDQYERVECNIYIASGRLDQSHVKEHALYPIPSLPNLKGRIDTIHPATSFDFGGFSGPKRVVRSSSSAFKVSKKKRLVCTNLTPPCLTQFYGVPSTPATQKSNQIAVSGFGGQFAQTDDLSDV